MKQVFYAVWGKNGVGVYTDYAEVVKIRRFLTYFNCKKCRTFSEARAIALQNYNLLNPGEEYNGPLTYNFTFYKADIIAIDARGIVDVDYVKVIFTDYGKEYLRIPFFKENH